jgi:ADP-ribosylglycohydrolase
MTRQELDDRILGAVVGATIGDALGGAFEGCSREHIIGRTGTDWIDDLWDYGPGFGAYGVWCANAPKGLGTDDTRMNHIFLETVIEHGAEISPQRLAMSYILRYQHPERYYHSQHVDLARAHLRDFYGVSCACLGMPCDLHPGAPLYALRERSFGCRFPTLIGLLSLACAGCLFAGRSIEAYKKAFELSYFDVGYAKEACGLHAAAVSMALGGVQDMAVILRELSTLDPFQFSASPFNEPLNRAAATAQELAEQAGDARELSVLLSRKLMPLHVFDPIDTLTVCFAANAFAKGDPREAILIAANHRNVDADGNLVHFRDNDCTGYVAGALAGALAGFSKLPAAWAECVLSANKSVYGIDIVKNVHAFCDVVHGERPGAPSGSL